ncbi:MAG: CBS domain-containing protein, partial [Balneolaceae bacterium]|nr:CBS domain-containing protein [Balneolaceae bacterium]
LNMSPEELQQTLSAINPENFLFYLLSANIMLVVFNVIPAFPMDGGRILRALLSMKLDRVRATQIASGMGQMVALFFFFIGLFYNPLLILIALFVFFGAQGENRMVQQLTLLRDHRVREAMMTDITVLKPDTTLDHVIDVILSGTERNFVVAEEDEVKGIVYQEELVKAIRERERDTEIREVMNRDFEIVNHDEPLTDVYRRVSSLSTSFFPVKKNGELAGAIDMENINEFISLRASLDY